MLSDEDQKLLIETINDVCRERDMSKPTLTKNLFPEELWETFNREDRRNFGREISRLVSIGQLSIRLFGKNAANHNFYIGI